MREPSHSRRRALSQPRRRRRRRRRGGQPSDPARRQQAAPSAQSAAAQPQQQGSQKKTRRRRGRGRGQARQPVAAKSSEDLVRAEPRERPATLTAAADGQTLEAIIGELQSVWGVPQYPQEYRITIKVAEERDQRPSEPEDNGRPSSEAPPPRSADGPRREKAPAAPLMRNRGPSEAGSGEGTSKRRRRGRRRRRGGSGGGSSNGGGGSPPS